MTHLLNNNTSIDCRFASLGAPGRIFAIPSIHGNLQKLYAVHESLFHQFRPGDRLVYLGNYTGYGPHSRQTVNSILSFRRCLLSMPGVLPSDIVYLRGTQEEMWQKLVQIQFAPNPAHVLEWMLSKGIAQTMESYNIDIQEALRVCREGIIRLSRWTESVRQKVYAHPGHDIFGAQLKRAAYTDCGYKQMGTCTPLLFVSGGVDFSRPLEEQGDSFWWGSPYFKHATQPYGQYQKIIRGYDPEQTGLHFGPVTATLDNNCGRGGNLVMAQISSYGDIEQLIET